MDKVVHDRAESHIGVAGYLEFREPSVKGKATITEPIDEVFGVTFFWDEGDNDTRLRRRQNK